MKTQPSEKDRLQALVLTAHKYPPSMIMLDQPPVTLAGSGPAEGGVAQSRSPSSGMPEGVGTQTCGAKLWMAFIAQPASSPCSTNPQLSQQPAAL